MPRPSMFVVPISWRADLRRVDAPLLRHVRDADEVLGLELARDRRVGLPREVDVRGRGAEQAL